jgi:hypothetical protein
MSILKYYAMQFKHTDTNWNSHATFSSRKAALREKEEMEMEHKYEFRKTHFRVVLYTGKVLTKIVRRKTLKKADAHDHI